MAKARSRRVAAQASKRVYVSQSDIPKFSLEDALRVATAISNEYAKKPTNPLNVALALQLSPASSHFRGLCGAALAYGLTTAGPQASEIGLTELGKRAVAPRREGEDLTARREAVLMPRVLGQFLRKYDRSKLPRPNIAANVLDEMGVPRDQCERTFDLIVESADDVGFLRELKGERYVDLSSVPPQDGETPEALEQETFDTASQTGARIDTSILSLQGDGNTLAEVVALPAVAKANRRVFVTHGKNRSFIESLKQLLMFGEFEPVVSVERETVSLPVPEKVMEDMRSCSAAIIHVDAEMDLIDNEGNRHQLLNPNVLIEIGAAMALYGARMILLVRKGITVPSNLQGLYRVEYHGDSLDGETTIRLLKSINDIKTRTQPTKW